MNNIQRSFTLCCGKGGCPVITEKPTGEIVITDDNNGRVELSKAQWKILKEIIKDGDI